MGTRKKDLSVDEIMARFNSHNESKRTILENEIKDIEKERNDKIRKIRNKYNHQINLKRTRIGVINIYLGNHYDDVADDLDKIDPEWRKKLTDSLTREPKLRNNKLLRKNTDNG